ncbi:Hpt domain-containing protein [Pseudomonas lurida]|uniref:Hpt domain-containing protein n=1 Tax=Pseudomonas quebecensis TaxID=2995174 RepID=A0ABY6QJS6_9PSED|nr:MULTISPECIES: Hpt domain-containing protein [Pseudomonas]MBA1291858.1 Hpt domain-containing protein [Pseudomonas lurida]MCP1512090.1 HPt (histidine-containing phosphotransfer) domain-containing protein [Pseudomonas rhodesiae]MCX4064052.1 Hpt domain-containing protein [Pseudomonas quebecensis]MDF9770921.1 HPt (histidine-containing phosphotransfer) domain-containing protein [Pseudomonas rhodesiae]UZW20074.1 Hpt domain-containing protein [Pseudomonas quebecensis]
MVDVHLDPVVLSGLQEVMESEYPKLLDTFLDDSQKRIEALRQSRGDAKALGRIAHSFKGSSGNLGAVRLAHLCQRLEAESAEAAGDLEALVDQIDLEFALVKPLYESERQRFQM